jgi:hypothetical protein
MKGKEKSNGQHIGKVHWKVPSLKGENPNITKVK